MLVFKRGPGPPLKKVKVKAKTSLDVIAQRSHAYLHKFLPHRDAQDIWLAGQHIHNMEERTNFYIHAVMEVEQRVNGVPMPDSMKDFNVYKYQPVSIEEFICSEYYLDKKTEIYPEVLKAAIELNSGKYVEAVLTGGIGSAKTTLALYTNAYQLYLLSCMRSPHKLFGLDPSSEILLIFQSINKTLAKSVDFARFKSMIQGSKYFAENFPYDKKLESKLVFPNRIEVVPVSGAETAAIGQNVIGGLIDELNYMAIVEKSKQSVDKGTFDQAIAVYNSIARRRKSRFIEQGKLPGILCLVSSKKYPGQFTDMKMEEAKTDPTIYVYDKRVWDIKPKGSFNKGWFNVFIGDMTRKPRILGPEEEVPDIDRLLVMAVPLEYRVDFERDIINSLREIAGVSTLARHPFFLEVDKVDDSFGKHPSIFSRDCVDFVESRVRILKKSFFKPELPRFVHVDLAISGDSAGLAVGMVKGFVDIHKHMSKLVSSQTSVLQSIAGQGETIFMPQFHIDGILEIRPPKNSEILFWKIREVILAMRGMGLNIRWVTFDQFQSCDSQQLLRQRGFVTGQQSVDTVPCKAYDFAKAAIYEGRVDIPTQNHAQKEMLMLEKDTKTGKVDHPPGGSKDCVDALAAVIYGLTMRREIWGMFGIPLVMIPNSITQVADKMQADMAMKELPDCSDTEKVQRRIRS